MLPTAFRPIFPLILDSCHGGSCFDVNFSRAPTLLAINVDYSREILQFHRISTQLSCPSPLLCATQQNMPRSTLKANKKLNSACFAKWSKISAVRCFFLLGVGGLFILTFSLQSNRSRWVVMKRNIAKGTTDPRVEFISQFLTQILIIFHLHNLHQVSTSKPNMNNWTSLLKLNFKILTTPSFRISTKIQLHSPYKTSAEKNDQTPASILALISTSKSWPNLVPKVSITV